MSNLVVYKSSAGSGKTYTLAREYLELLFRDPESYRHILAVTFTNKAAWEMKVKILSELYLLNHQKDQGNSNLAYLMEMTVFDQDQIRRRAGYMLGMILHNYSRFHVMTIDRFFQKIIRGFARDIGIQAGYTVELDHHKVLDHAIDELFSGLSEDPLLLQWLAGFARERIIEGGSWNLKYLIRELSREIFNERFQMHRSELKRKFTDRKFLRAYKKDLYRIIKSYEENLMATGRAAMELVNRNGLQVEDFKYGKTGPVGYLEALSAGRTGKVPGTRVCNALDDAEGWYSAGSEKKKQISYLVKNGLGELLAKAVRKFEDEFAKYETARLVVRNIYILGILSDVSERVYAYASEMNFFLLSDANRFLKDIIGENEAPFIYEKTGEYFHHFMIDEFQDTSILQYDNFKPLIADSLARNYKSMLVGDIKQSIYRWRNGDWEILSDMIGDDFRHFGIAYKPLVFNWRSREVIVECNNRFFSTAADILQSHLDQLILSGGSDQDLQRWMDGRLKKVYQDVRQEVPGHQKKKKAGGYVRFEFLESSNKQWQEDAVRNTISVIEQLQERGYHPGDIAILARTGEEVRKMTDAILDYKDSSMASEQYSYDTISQESLFVGSSSAVQLIISIMKFLNQPGDRINKAFLLHESQTILSASGRNPGKLFMSAGNHEDESILLEYLPDEFVKTRQWLKNLPLYELTEEIVRIFSLSGKSRDLPFINAFQDLVTEYAAKEPSDNVSFLEWWEEEGKQKNLSISEQQDAIRIMTIHKAKGLEFPVVILPFCDWKLDHHANQTILWCKPEIRPFDGLPLVPVLYSGRLENSFFSGEYYREKLKIFVDHFNLLYVSMTRACDELYLFMPDKPSDKGMTDIADLVLSVARKEFTKDRPVAPGKGKNYKSRLEFGLPAKVLTEEKRGKTCKMSAFRSVPLGDRLKLRFRGDDFFDPAGKDKVSYGRIMHEVFEMIETRDDLDRAMEEIFRQGKMGRNECMKMRSHIEGIISRKPWSYWFSDKWKVINEREMITGAGKIRRPDRVMIQSRKVVVLDYKFGRRKENIYASQVREYMSHLSAMGFQEIEGYVWYVMLDELQKITRE